jgi:hypothetical protein
MSSSGVLGCFATTHCPGPSMNTPGLIEYAAPQLMQLVSTNHSPGALSGCRVAAGFVVAMWLACQPSGICLRARRSCTGECYSNGCTHMARKNYRIDDDKLKRARRVLGTANETETIHRALDLVVNEAALVEAVREFVRRGHGRIDNADASRS